MARFDGVKRVAGSGYSAAKGAFTTWQANRKAAADKPQTVDYSAGFADILKDKIIAGGSFLIPIGIMFAMFFSSGFLFSDFQPFSTALDFNGKLAYFLSFLLEFGILIAVYSANKNLKYGNRGRFWIIFAGMIVLAFVSAIAQYVYLLHTATAIKPSDVNNVPILNILIGFSGAPGNEVWFFVRALVFHLLEVFCTFLFSKTEKTLAMVTKENRERTQAELNAATDAAMLEVTTGVQEIVTETIESVGNMVQVVMRQTLSSIEARNMGAGETADPLAKREPITGPITQIRTRKK